MRKGFTLNFDKVGGDEEGDDGVGALGIHGDRERHELADEDHAVEQHQRQRHRQVSAQLRQVPPANSNCYVYTLNFIPTLQGCKSTQPEPDK